MCPEVRTVHDELVSTFNVAPDTDMGQAFKFDFDTYGVLTVAERYEDWRMQVVNTGDRVCAEDTPLRTAEQVLSGAGKPEVPRRLPVGQKPVVPQRISAADCREFVASNPDLYSGPTLHSSVDSGDDEDSYDEYGERQRRELDPPVGSFDDDGEEMSLASILAELEGNGSNEPSGLLAGSSGSSSIVARTELATATVMVKQLGIWMNDDGSFEVEV